MQDLVGGGGMGRVYRAEQSMLGRTVAVKVIHPHLLGDDQTVARFYNEARAASRMNHPDSVSIIDFGRTEDGILYLVMEYLDGRDLARILSEEGPLPFLRICRVLRHVLSALGEAHALGVVHRDLKPENVIVRKVRRGAEQVKVVDFGLAHIVGTGGTSITTPGLVCGTPDYMSPEQGKGETVDGRGDLYSVGVVLFEMLTDRLPFEDDTPTKVVFKHIHDAVPDPRAVAPYRAIPDDLAEVCLRALRKRREDRFQSADEMFEALLAVEQRLESVVTGNQTTCPACGASNPASMRFCGECGTRLTDRFTIPPSFRSQAPPDQPGYDLSALTPLVGREPELDRLLELRQRAQHEPLWVRMVGEGGVGKSRLVAEVAKRVAEYGDIVVAAGPHPSGAPIPYWPVRKLLLSLLDVEAAKLGEIAQNNVVGDAIARAGIGEVLDPTGLPGRDGEPRSEAVALALAASVRVAAARARSGGVTLLVDDFGRCDSLSRRALALAVDRVHDVPMFLVSASQPRRDVGRSDRSVKMLLRGLEIPDALQMLRDGRDEAARGPVRRGITPSQHRAYLPLYVDQLRALGYASLDNDGQPERLADAVLQRLERLRVDARRLLQGIAVLGDHVVRPQLEHVLPGGDLGGLDELLSEGLVRVEAEGFSVAHPFIRELVEGSIPAEARKELHSRALAAVGADEAPLEERAEHAWRAGEPITALLLLERMGDRSLSRGDPEAAVLAFQRGLELARRELLMTGETSLDRAIVTFSRKLGDAMDRSGDHAAADGVLREALELAGPGSRELPRMLLALGRVAKGRSRQRDATRFFGQALELAERQGDASLEAEARLALGLLRLENGETLAAAETLKQVLALTEDADDAHALRLRAAMARSDALRALGRSTEAVMQLESARTLAEQAVGQAAQARVLALLGETLNDQGDSVRAAGYYREAGRLAAEAGDAGGAVEWHRLGRVTGARQAG
ncbi:MAG: protein kinase [Sandaracinaceae bacterium]